MQFYSHQPIEKLEENLWIVEGPVPGPGPLHRRMTVIRLKDKNLVIHSAIALDDNGLTELTGFGEPRYLFVPNHFHRIDADKYKQTFHQMKVICPQASRRKVAKKVDVDGDAGLLPNDESVQAHMLRGTKDREYVLTINSIDGVTLLFNDALFNMPAKKGIMRLLQKIMGYGGLRVSVIGKMVLVQNKKEFANRLRELAETPRLKRVIVSHGNVVATGAAAKLKQAAALLE